MTDFYKMDPAAWDFGTANLSLEEEAAYLRIVNAMHKHKGPVPDNDRVLSGMFRCSTRKARSLLNALIDAGKLTIEGGMISNFRAASDLVHRGFVSSSMSENGAKGGRTKAERAAKSLESKDTGVAIASPREEKRREEKNTPIAPKGDRVQEILQEVLSNDVASDFIAHRKSKRAKMTDRAAQLIVGQLRGHPSPDAVALHSISNGWTGVFPESYKPSAGSDQRKPNKWAKL